MKTEPSPTTTETKASLKVSPTTAAPTSEATTQTTTRPKRTQDTTTAQPTTTAPPTTAQPSSTEKPTTTALTTTAAPTASAAKPTTAAAITGPQRNISECGTAIVGAGEIWIPPFGVKLCKGSLLLSIVNVKCSSLLKLFFSYLP